MIYVKKLDGTLQKYNPSKLRNSLSNAGANKEVIDRIMQKVEKIIHNEIETRELFKFVFNEFKKEQPNIAPIYDLRNSLLRLGTTGFAFEKFVSHILKKQGYSIKLNQIIKGRYVKHEIDIFAVKNDEKVMVECKYHLKPWIRCDIQTALYVYARFLDVKQHFTAPMLITNTKFSNQAMDYSKGVRLKLMGWRFPQDNSLEYNIEKFRIFPITMLSSLNKDETDILLSKDITLISELLKNNNNELCSILKINRQKADKILEEAKKLV